MCGDFQGTYSNRIERDCAGFRGPRVESDGRRLFDR